MLTKDRHRSRPARDEGFTLMEVMVTVAIIGVISAALTGIVISYFKTSVDTRSRLTESLDLQFATTYWQRDVASIGLRDTNSDTSTSTGSFALLKSVGRGEGFGCAAPQSGDSTLITLKWGEYDEPALEDDDVDPLEAPDEVAVTYFLRPQSGSRMELVRVRCGVGPARVVVARNLTEVDVLCFNGGAAVDCDASAVPTRVDLVLTVSDPDGHGNTDITEAVISGERRQT